MSPRQPDIVIIMADQSAPHPTGPTGPTGPCGHPRVQTPHPDALDLRTRWRHADRGCNPSGRPAAERCQPAICAQPHPRAAAALRARLPPTG